MQWYLIWNGSGGNSRFFWNTVQGVCGWKDLKVTWLADLEFVGTWNGLQYVVVVWFKVQFLAVEVVDMYVNWGDLCDVELWKGMWLDPVLGSIVWFGKEVFIVECLDMKSFWLFVRMVLGGELRMKKMMVIDEGLKIVVFVF